MFSTSPLEPVLNGDWILSDGTTWWYKFGASGDVANAKTPVMSTVGHDPRKISLDAGGVIFGDDRDTTFTVEFDSWALDTPTMFAEDVAEQFIRLARQDMATGQTLTVTTKYRQGVRMAYVRCRAAAITNPTPGAVEMALNFESVAPWWFATPSTVTAKFGTADNAGGLKAKLKAPLSTATTTTKATTVDAVSDGYMVAKLTGPIGGPSLTVAARTWSFPSLTLGVGESVTIDTRPWRRGVLNDAGRPVAHQTVGPTGQLLPSGRLAFTLQGSDNTGNSQAQITVFPRLAHF